MVVHFTIQHGVPERCGVLLNFAKFLHESLSPMIRTYIHISLSLYTHTFLLSCPLVEVPILRGKISVRCHAHTVATQRHGWKEIVLQDHAHFSS